MNKFFSIIFVVILSGCDVGVGSAHRSGTIKNDYKEDVVPKKYANALKVTNYVVQALIAEQYSYITENYVDLSIAKNFNKNEIKSYYDNVKKNYGNATSSLENQWGFVPKTVEGEELIFSVKIVEHENKTLHYIITFVNDGEFRRIIGISIEERNGVRSPTEL